MIHGVPPLSLVVAARVADGERNCFTSASCPRTRLHLVLLALFARGVQVTPARTRQPLLRDKGSWLEIPRRRPQRVGRRALAGPLATPREPSGGSARRFLAMRRPQAVCIS